MKSYLRIYPQTVLLTFFIFAGMLMFSAVQAQENVKDLADAEITFAIESEFLVDRLINSNKIDISTKEGIVTLGGTVDNLLVRDRAERIAEAVKGVRAVVNQIDVDVVEREDTDIRNDVIRLLARDPAADSYEIEVSVNNGIVKMDGLVDSHQEKKLAEKIVKGVRGVREIENNIGILYPDIRTDSEIKRDVMRRLQWDIWLEADQINISVIDGEVTLEGLVSSAQEKKHAYDIAWVTGVTEVDTSGLEVEWWTRRQWEAKKVDKNPSDENIQEAIRDALRYDPRVDAEGVKITVVDGKVTLAGKVDNLRAKRAAAEDSRNAMGVWRVTNYIKVRPEKITSDSVMAELIEDHWKVDPLVDAEDMEVTVFEGQAVISGEADHYLEKVEAEDLAASVYGVVHVVNNIVLSQAWEDKEDWILKEDVEYQLYWNPRVDSDSIDVMVDDGMVTLVGKVSTLYERRQATREAKQAGAENVRNLLVYSLGPPAIIPRESGQ